MKKKLISYLQDHKDQILEIWLSDLELPRSIINQNDSLPLPLLSDLFEEIMQHIATPATAASPSLQNLHRYLNQQYPQHPQERNTVLCLETIISGYTAFLSILNPQWDCSQEFTPQQHEQHAQTIRTALAQTLHQQTQGKRHYPSCRSRKPNMLSQSESTPSQSKQYSV